MPFDAFISYSHAADGLFAPRLQDGLQRIAKPWYRRRALHVFRDETGLSVNPGLWSSIAGAIDESSYFVLLASPEAAHSEWVNREIDHWVSHKDPGRILCVVTEGEWAWDTAANDFDFAASTAVPLSLAGVFAEEPRHIDMRWAHEETQLDLRNGLYRDSVAALAAAIHGIPKEDLAGRDVAEHRRTVRTAWGAAVLLLLLTLLAGTTAVAAATNAARARDARRAADANAAEAEANAEEARTNATEAERQRISAEVNALEADANAQTAAQAQQLAEANAEEARVNAAEAGANADRAQANADEAQANLTEADRQRGAALASAEEARLRQEDADRSAAEAQSQRAAAQRAADQLAQQNVALDAAARANADLARANAEALARQIALTGALNGAQLIAFADSERSKGNFDTAMLVAARGMDVSPDQVAARNEALAVQQSMQYVDRYLPGPPLSSSFASTLAFTGGRLLGADVGGTAAVVWNMSRPGAPPLLLDVSSLGTITSGSVLSPDGTRAVVPVSVTAPVPGYVFTVWDTTTGVQLWSTARSEAVDTPQISPDGSLVALQEGGFDDPHVVVVDLATARVVFEWDGFLGETFSFGCRDVAGPGSRCGFSADSRYVLANDDGDIVVFDRQHPQQTATLYTATSFPIVSPAPRFLDGGLVLGAPDPQTLSVFALDGTRVRDIPVTTGSLIAVALSGDGRTIVMTDTSGTVTRADSTTGASTVLTQLPLGCAADFNSITFSPDGSWVTIVVSPLVCDSVQFYVPTAAPLDDPPVAHAAEGVVAWGRDASGADRYAISFGGNVADMVTGIGSSLEWNHLGSCVPSPTNDRVVCGDLVLSLDDFTPSRPIARSIAPYSLKAFDDEGGPRLFGITLNGRVIVADTSLGAPGSLVFQQQFAVGPADEPVLFTSIAPDRSEVAIGTATAITLMRQGGSEPVLINAEGNWKFGSAHFIADGRRLLVFRTRSTVDTIIASTQIFDTSDGTVLDTFDPLTSVSGDGRVIAVINGERLEFRNTSDLTVRTSMSISNIPSVGVLNYDGSILAAWSGDLLLLVDTATGAHINSRFTGTPIHQAEFSPDGLRLALTSDHDVAVIDVFSLNELIRDRADLGNVCTNVKPSYSVRVEWSPDSTLLLLDTHLLDARTLSQVGSPLSCDAVSFTGGAAPAINYVVLTEELLFDLMTVDVRSLPIGAAALRARGCDLAGRDFTQSEWERFNPGATYTPTCPH